MDHILRAVKPESCLWEEFRTLQIRTKEGKKVNQMHCTKKKERKKVN